MSPPPSVLIVEDDDDAREALSELLQGEGYGVAEAENGQAALRWLANHPAPCVILLDLMMPVLSGEQFLALRARDARLAAIPVIVLSAVHDSEVARLGVRDCLSKPVDPRRVLAAVGRHCQPTSGA
jgi:CheY-like chemotaxis protein